MRVLLTGGTGFIGRNTLPALLAANHDVTLLVSEKYADGRVLSADMQAIWPHIHIVSADLRNSARTRRAVVEANPDAVIHLAAVGSTDPFLPVETAIAHNVNGTINLLRAVFETSRAQQVIIARTPGEITAMNIYATSKAAAWNFCQMYANISGWPIVGAMIFQAYGWYQPSRALIPSAFAAAAQNKDFPMTVGTQERDWIAVEDVAAGLNAMLATSLAPTTTVQLGTGTLTSIVNIVQSIYTIVAGSGVPLVGSLPSRQGETLQQVANRNQTAAQIDWQSSMSVQQGLQAYWQQYQRELI